MTREANNRPVFNTILFCFLVFGSVRPSSAQQSSYQTADHYWPMYNITDGILEDVNGAAQTVVHNGARTVQVAQLGSALVLDGHDRWVDIGGFNADCVTNPSKCKEGFTVTFWLKVHSSGYVISSGSFTTHEHGPGFRLFYKQALQRLEFLLEAGQIQWTLKLHEEVGFWTHMAFTWRHQTGLTYYEDGNLSTYTRTPVFLSSLRPQNYNPVITLARPHNLTNIVKLNQYGKFEISQFAIWLKELSAEDIAGVYQSGVTYDNTAPICCHFKAVSSCISDPCYDADLCRRNSQSNESKCICPSVNLRLKTCAEKITGKCNDKSSGCSLFAKQTRYCKHWKMREICPRSCSYCGSVAQSTLIRRETVPFSSATHYWPLNSTTKDKLIDIRGNSSAKANNGVSNQTEFDQLSNVLSLDGEDDNIFISGIQEKCIVDPTYCAEGLSVAFWLKYTKGEFIISGGNFGSNSHGPGFRFICEGCVNKKGSYSGKFLLELSTRTQRWKLIMESIPKWWFHFAFTWTKERGLSFYENGKRVMSNTKPEVVKVRTRDGIPNELTIGLPNSMFKISNSHGKFSIGHLVIWTNELSSLHVETAFLILLTTNKRSISCCNKMEVDPCLTNPCHNGATCQRMNEEYECVCPEVNMSQDCSKEQNLPEPCVDNESVDCEKLANQDGYCRYHWRRMKNVCPKACNFCAAEPQTVQTAFYVTVTTLNNGTNQTQVLDGKVLLKILRTKRQTLQNRLNITIASISANLKKVTTTSLKVRPDPTPGSYEHQTSLATFTAPTSAVVGRVERQNPQGLSQTLFIVIMCFAMGAFVLLIVVLIYLLTRFYRRRKGEFVPEESYPHYQTIKDRHTTPRENGGGIPSFVDPSLPRITDVPHKPSRAESTGRGGAGKKRKPMGVKITYKPPEWD